MTDFSFAISDNLEDLGTTVTKYEHNVSALRILKELEAEGRTEATLHEQTILSRYTGWGDSTVLKRAFPHGVSPHLPPSEELKELLTGDELKAMRASSLNAHYTSLPVIRAIYAGLLHAGLHHVAARGGTPLRLLEPAAGVGHFIGAMPPELRGRSECAAVELDGLSARITGLLYPSARLFAEGFETANLPPDWFDLVISNVPFGNYKVCDPEVREHYLRASIHDYYFVKALRVTRPGGCVAFITSRFTLDKQDARLRTYLAARAELLAAVRLPNDAFARNAGTQVVTDIIILRKRAEPLVATGEMPAWTEAQDTTVLHETGTPTGVTLNRLFIAGSDLMLGQATIGAHGMYGRNEFTVKPDGRDLAPSLEATLRRVLPESLFAAPIASASAATAQVTTADVKPSAPEPDPLEQAAQAELVGMGEGRAGLERARGENLLAIYHAAKHVIRLQMNGADDETLHEAQAELNRLYDRFRVRFGYINSKTNLLAFRKGNGLLAFLRALEEAKRWGAYGKAPIFSTRTIRPLRDKSSADTAQEALLLCLNEQGRVDLTTVAGLCRKTEGQTREELRGLVFQTPSGELVTRDEYLSGNVRARLKEAEAAAQFDHSFDENVTALKEAQPTPLGAGEITARLGAAWIPVEVIDAFARFLVPRYKGRIKYLAPTAQWVVDPPGGDTIETIECSQVWGTRRVHALDILEDALNLRRTVVYDQIDEKTRVVNQVETTAAQAKLQEVKDKFSEWVWQDAKREQELCRLYNESFNATRERAYDGSHLSLPGASTEIELRPHQRDAVWRILQSETTLIGHCVGAGKAQPLTAKILTPTGWKRMGEIKVGDEVIAGDGTATHVTGVYPQGSKMIYRVTMSDDSATECCSEHLWKTQTYQEREYYHRGLAFPFSGGAIRPLWEIQRTMVARNGIKNHSTPMVGAVEFKPQSIPLDAYLLGVLLGDGSFRHKRVNLTTWDQEIVDACRHLLPAETIITTRTSGRGEYSLCGTQYQNHRINPALTAVRGLGLAEKQSSEKFVPEVYKFNSVEVRIGILQGLLDTDGTVSKNGTSVYFNSSSRQLAEDVKFLVQSLGGLARIRSKYPRYTHNGEKRTGLEHFTVTVSLPPDVRPFRLKRKAKLVIPKTKYQPTRYITGIEKVGDQEAQCISIDHPSRLYVTDDFIVTHNTLTAIAAAHELRRLNLARKSMIVVPKHVVPQWAQEAQRLYPGLRMLTTDAKDFTRHERGETLSRIATGDWDLIIVPHPSFKLLPVSLKTSNEFVNAEIERLRDYIVELGDENSRENKRSIKQLEKTLKKFEARLKSQNAEIKHDDTQTITFEELGVEALFVDEFHCYKNLYFPTKMSRIAGLSNSESQQAFDMFIKMQWLMAHGGRIVALTGTPVSNTLCEVWIMMRYLQLDLLKQLGMDHFDAWAQAFAETTTGVEMRPDGSGFRVHTRFNKFVNLPELSRLWRQCLDVRTPEQLDLPRPKVAGGSPVIVSVPASAELVEFVGELSYRSEKVRSREVHPSVDNMLKITSEGRKAALDMRLVRPDLGELPDNKIDALVARVGNIYQRTRANRGAQIVFCDLATPKGRGGSDAKDPQAAALEEAA